MSPAVFAGLAMLIRYSISARARRVPWGDPGQSYAAAVGTSCVGSHLPEPVPCTCPAPCLVFWQVIVRDLVGVRDWYFRVVC